MAEDIPRPKTTVEDMEARLRQNDPAELERFAAGESTDVTLDITWTEEEMIEVAKRIVAERAAQ